MSTETKSMHITPAGGNVFADLGFEPNEAAALKAESQRIISEKLAIKDLPCSRLAIPGQQFTDGATENSAWALNGDEPIALKPKL